MQSVKLDAKIFLLEYEHLSIVIMQKIMCSFENVQYKDTKCGTFNTFTLV